jgi:two-component system, OmpR family, copper resistance phosphate regulon response regulator CusR
VRVLIIESEPGVARTLVKGLEANHFAVDLIGDGASGLQLATEVEYDAIVLNWNLPGMDGMTVLTKLRKSGSLARMLFLSRNDNVADRVCALRAGANDFMVKPFSFEELLARLNTLLRRPQEVQDMLSVGDLTLDRVHHVVSRAGRQIPLTSREYSILECLMRNAGRVLTRAVIEAQVLNLAHENAGNVVDVFISYLRGKVDRGFTKPLIHTIRGVGYSLSAAEQDGSTDFSRLDAGKEAEPLRDPGVRVTL